jgi:hypothetical protein
MRILNLVFGGAMEWVNKLKDLEDVSAGIYIKARADIALRDSLKCPYHKQGLFACEFGLDEIDQVYLDELIDIGYVKTQKQGKKLILILGENFQWFTDPKTTEHPTKEFIKFYNSLCANHDIPNNGVLEPKTFGMIKQIMAKRKWKEVIEFAFKNWSWLKKELNVGLPTLNVFASSYYWRRIENQFESKPALTHVGNRHTVSEDDTQFEAKAPKIKK